MINTDEKRQKIKITRVHEYSWNSRVCELGIYHKGLPRGGIVPHCSSGAFKNCSKT